MSHDELPRILVVDDEDASQHAVGLETNADTLARHPNDVELEDLDWADLVLMDFVIRRWPERDALEGASLRPLNGLALAAVLREHADSRNGDNADYTAFAIHTGRIGELSRRLHSSNNAAHAVARLNNLEWVFDKSDASRFERSTELAAAVRTISSSWKAVEIYSIEKSIEHLMGLSAECPWYSRAFDDIVLCQVPFSDFSTGTNGLLFLRWLLHSILPYPTFLWGDHWVAARLRITLSSLRTVLDAETDLARDLADCRYNGILRSFLNRRWWRAGVEQYAWGIRAEGARDPEAFHQKLEKLAGIELEALDIASPVVCIERDLTPAKELSSLDDAVRLVPDLWPAYADSAYATISSLREDTDFAAVVHPLDRERVEDDSGDDDASEE